MAAELRLISPSPVATEALGEALGRCLSSGAVIALTGELGAGKTCFVRGLARGLEVEEAISSPSYALHHLHAGRLELHHLDAWMEGRERAFLADGGAEWLADRGVVAVEWAERVADCLPPARLWVRLEHDSEQRRRIALWTEGAGAERQRLDAALHALELPAALTAAP